MAHLMLAFMGALFTLSSVSVIAQTPECGSNVVEGVSELRVSPSGGDDTQTLQCAVDLARDAGFARIALEQGDFFVSAPVFIENYRGEITGISQSLTRLVTRDQAFDCTAGSGDNAVFVNYSSSVAMSKFNLVASSPCVAGTNSSFRGLFISPSPEACNNRTMFNVVDRVLMEYLGQPANVTAVEVKSGPGCGDTNAVQPIGTLKINQSTFTEWATALDLRLVAGAQVDVNFNTFEANSAGVKLSDSYVNGSVFGNFFLLPDTSSQPAIGVVRNGATAPSRNKISISGNIFDGGDDSAGVVELVDFAPSSNGIFEYSIAGNVFKNLDVLANAVLIEGVDGGFIALNQFTGSVFEWMNFSNSSNWSISANQVDEALGFDLTFNSGSERNTVAPGQFTNVNDLTGRNFVLEDLASGDSGFGGNPIDPSDSSGGQSDEPAPDSSDAPNCIPTFGSSCGDVGGDSSSGGGASSGSSSSGTVSGSGSSSSGASPGDVCVGSFCGSSSGSSSSGVSSGSSGSTSSSSGSSTGGSTSSSSGSPVQSSPLNLRVVNLYSTTSGGSIAVTPAPGTLVFPAAEIALEGGPLNTINVLSFDYEFTDQNGVRICAGGSSADSTAPLVITCGGGYAIPNQSEVRFFVRVSSSVDTNTSDNSLGLRLTVNTASSSSSGSGGGSGSSSSSSGGSGSGGTGPVASSRFGPEYYGPGCGWDWRDCLIYPITKTFDAPFRASYTVNYGDDDKRSLSCNFPEAELRVTLTDPKSGFIEAPQWNVRKDSSGLLSCGPIIQYSQIPIPAEQYERFGGLQGDRRATFANEGNDRFEVWLQSIRGVQWNLVLKTRNLDAVVQQDDFGSERRQITFEETEQEQEIFEEVYRGNSFEDGSIRFHSWVNRDGTPVATTIGQTVYPQFELTVENYTSNSGGLPYTLTLYDEAENTLLEAERVSCVTSGVFSSSSQGVVSTLFTCNKGYRASVIRQRFDFYLDTKPWDQNLRNNRWFVVLSSSGG